MKIGIYKHYKGNLYEIIGIAKDSENLEDIVVYKGILKGDLWVRTKKEFLEKIILDGKKIDRFKYIGNENYKVS